MTYKSFKYLLFTFLILGLLLGSYQGIWKQGAKKVTTTPIQNKQSNQTFVEIIWDASGSMWGQNNNIRKILKSKDIINNLNEKLSDNIYLGLRIFGARKTGDVNDSFLAVPFDKHNQTAINNYIKNIKPLGKSPIGLSLLKAQQDLAKHNGKKYILLISDGKNNGKFSLNKVINNLSKSKITLHTIYVGNIENKSLQNKLRQVTKATGGNYYTYKNHLSVLKTLINE